MMGGGSFAALSALSDYRGGEAAAAQHRSAPRLFEHMQAQSRAHLSAPGEEALLAITQAFRRTGAQDAKKALPKNFSEFVEIMRKAKVLSRDAFEKDPEAFWQMMWHSQSVQHLYTEYGWDMAAEYHRLVMEAWGEGHLDLPSFVDTEENRRGDVAGAVHPRFFQVAMNATNAKPKTKATGVTASATLKTKCTFCHSQGHVRAECNKLAKQQKEAKAAAAKLKLQKP
jgi:hypothetical protein